MAGMRMPNRYVAEMVCDRIAASKNYKGTSYTDAAAWEYYEHSRDPVSYTQLDVHKRQGKTGFVLQIETER